MDNDRIIKLIKSQTEILEDHNSFHSRTIDQISSLWTVVIKLIELYRGLLFLVMIVIVKVYFLNTINNFLIQISQKWANLSENWQIAIIMLIASIPAGIIVALISRFLIKMIDNYKKKSKLEVK